MRRPGSEAVLDHEQDEAQVWEAELIPVLTDTGVGRDDQAILQSRCHRTLCWLDERPQDQKKRVLTASELREPADRRDDRI